MRQLHQKRIITGLLISLVAGVLLLFLSPLPSFAVCIMPPGYDPANDLDINLDLSGWEAVPGDPADDQFDFEHPIDPNAPQLSTLIAELCDPEITSVNMISGTDRPPMPDIPPDYANLICLATPAGAPVLVPNSGYDMGGGCEAAVLYATSNSIVLKYTPDDNIVSGYTVYINNFQVDPGLLAYYNEQQGSGSAPCLSGGERIGVSSGETCVAIRDTGMFMDPRWQEWWNQCPAIPLDLLLKLIDLCTGVLPPLGLCHLPFPESLECCPVELTQSAPGWLIDLFFNYFGEEINRLFAFLNVSFTLRAEGLLDRSEWLPADANFHWASFKEEYDSRRISLPDEEPEAGMWPGAALRLAPPNSRPSWMWAPQRKTRLKWEIPLGEYGVDPWWGDGGKDGDRNRPAHHALMMGAEDEFNQLIRTPATEELVATARRERLARENSSTASVCSAPKIVSSPKTGCDSSTISLLASPKNGSDFSASLVKTTPATDGENGSASSQTPGVQLANAEPCLGLTPSAAYENGQINFGINVCALGGTYDVRVDVWVNGAKYSGGFGPTRLRKGNCVYAGTPADWAPISTSTPGVYNITFTFSVFGACPQPDPLNCTVTINQDGTSESTCGTPPPSLPAEAEICNPPYLAGNKNVCSITGPRPITAANAVKLLLDYILGTFKLFPKFTYLERISYRLAGIATDMFKDYKEAGIGGVFNAFLPPGWSGESLPAPNEYPTLDAPFELPMFLDVSISAPCIPPFTAVVECCNKETGICSGVGSCAECDTATETCKSRCCLGPLCRDQFSITASIKLEPKDGPLRMRYLGSQTQALDVTQTWLRPPVWGL